MFDGLVACAGNRWRHDSGARRVWFMSQPGSPMKEERFVLGTFRSERQCKYFTDHAKTIVFEEQAMKILPDAAKYPPSTYGVRAR
ncbi:hypothetical protein TNCV_1065921 [Trichonephila clavipes]|nr:hypothetical protein TNCV_1065921 [Trichonephila clavipes]